MHQRTFVFLHLPTHHRQVLPRRFVIQKLPHQHVAVSFRLREQHHSRRKPIDAMHYIRPFFSAPQRIRKQRPRRLRIRSLHGNRRQSRGLVQRHHRIVFVEHFGRSDARTTARTSRSPTACTFLHPRLTTS